MDRNNLAVGSVRTYTTVRKIPRFWAINTLWLLWHQMAQCPEARDSLYRYHRG